MRIEQKKFKELDQLPLDMPLEDVKSCYILKVLEHNRYNRTYTAKSLRISLRNLRNILDRLKVEGYEFAESARTNRWKTSSTTKETYNQLNDLSSAHALIEKLMEQNDYLGKEVKKLIDKKIKLEKRLKFYQDLALKN